MSKILTAVLILTIMVSFATAQEKGQFGINMKVDPSPQIGLSYHLSQ